MRKWLVKVAVMTVLLIGVAMAPLIIAAQILTDNKSHHTTHAPAHHSSATSAFERLKRGG